MRQFLKNFALIAIGLIAGVAATVQLSATAQQGTQLPLDELRTLSNVFAQIKREYVEPIEDKQLLTDAVKGMVSSLDPHSTFLDKKDFAEMQEQTSGKFAGLGIEITSRELTLLLERFAKRKTGEDIVMPQVNGQRGNPILFSRKAVEAILATPRLACRPFMDLNPSLIDIFETAHDAFILDVDTDADIQRLGIGK